MDDRTFTSGEMFNSSLQWLCIKVAKIPAQLAFSVARSLLCDIVFRYAWLGANVIKFLLMRLLHDFANRGGWPDVAGALFSLLTS